MKLRAYLVDDEPLAVDRLRRLLEQTVRVEVVGATMVPEEAVQALTETLPDVCFLDIHMLRLTGFEVLARLPRQPVVIFTTAYDRYALQAFGVNSVDYLLKPIEPDALQRALDKVDRLRSSGDLSRGELEAMLRDMAAALHAPKREYPTRLASRLGDRLCFIDVDRITHFYAEDKLTWAASEGKAYCIDLAITELEKRLDPKQFIRVHRGSLVNFAWVREVSPLPGGSLSLRLKDAKTTELTVARDRAAEFRHRIGI